VTAFEEWWREYGARFQAEHGEMPGKKAEAVARAAWAAGFASGLIFERNHGLHSPEKD